MRTHLLADFPSIETVELLVRDALNKTVGMGETVLMRRFHMSTMAQLSVLAVLQLLFINLATPSALAQTAPAPSIPAAIESAVENSIANGASQLASGIQDVPSGPANSSFFGQQAQAIQPASGWFDNTPMRLGIRVDTLILSKSGNDDEPFVFDATTGETLLSYSDIDSDAEAAARIRLTYQSDWGTGFELGYFDFGSFTGFERAPNSIPLFFGGIPAEQAPSYDISDVSQLTSLELNVWARKNQRFRFGLGLRHIDFRNEFDTIETGSNSGNSLGNGFFADTDNDLYGGQVMAELYVPVRAGAQLEAGIRVGGYNNNVTVLFDSGSRDLFYQDSDNFSAVIDWNVGLAWQVSNHFTIRAGYQAIYITDLATAFNQSTDFDFFETSAPVQFSDINFSGGYVGGELRF